MRFALGMHSAPCLTLSPIHQVNPLNLGEEGIYTKTLSITSPPPSLLCRLSVGLMRMTMSFYCCPGNKVQVKCCFQLQLVWNGERGKSIYLDWQVDRCCYRWFEHPGLVYLAQFRGGKGRIARAANPNSASETYGWCHSYAVHSSYCHWLNLLYQCPMW